MVKHLLHSSNYPSTNDSYTYLKTSSSKPAISMITEKPENKILLLQKIYL